MSMKLTKRKPKPKYDPVRSGTYTLTSTFSPYSANLERYQTGGFSKPKKLYERKGMMLKLSAEQKKKK
jgi:hypothetical protein